MSDRITVTDEMIEKGREAREGHYLRVSPVGCTCGWKSGTLIEADGLPRYEAHLVELALEAVLPDIIRQAKAQALREAADDIERRISEPGLILLADKHGGFHAGERHRAQREVDLLRVRADRIEQGDQP